MESSETAEKHWFSRPSRQTFQHQGIKAELEPEKERLQELMEKLKERGISTANQRHTFSKRENENRRQ